MIKVTVWVGIIAIIIACFFGLHSVMDSANKQEVETLKSTISMLQTQKEDIEIKLVETKNIVEKCKENTVSENLDESEISERLVFMLEQRDILLDIALSQATKSIDPRSEIASHIALLQSESEDNQATALNFLFEIRDPVTFKSLQDYFMSDSERISFDIHTIHDWYELFLELDELAGVEFVVNELGNQNFYNSKIAFETLERSVENSSIARKAKPSLETLALISDNASARGYAKILLEKISNMSQEAQ